MTDVAETNKVQTEGTNEVEMNATHSHNTVHARLRANSSIMQAKKILGEQCHVLNHALNSF